MSKDNSESRRPGRKPQTITEKELIIMKMLWTDGPLFVREMLDRYPEPKPHVNTVATTVRILEEKGHIAHEAIGGAHRFHAVTEQRQLRERSWRSLVSDFFHNSYRSAVSALVEEEKISVEELREIIEMIEKNSNPKQS